MLFIAFNTLLTAYWALYQLMLLWCCSGSCCYCDCCCFYCLKCACCCCCCCYCGCCCDRFRQRNSFDHTLPVPFGSVYTMISKMSSLSHRWNRYLYICLTDCGYCSSCCCCCCCYCAVGNFVVRVFVVDVAGVVFVAVAAVAQETHNNYQSCRYETHYPG